MECVDDGLGLIGTIVYRTASKCSSLKEKKSNGTRDRQPNYYFGSRADIIEYRAYALGFCSW